MSAQIPGGRLRCWAAGQPWWSAGVLSHRSCWARPWFSFDFSTGHPHTPPRFPGRANYPERAYAGFDAAILPLVCECSSGGAAVYLGNDHGASSRQPLPKPLGNTKGSPTSTAHHPNTTGACAGGHKCTGPGPVALYLRDFSATLQGWAGMNRGGKQRGLQARRVPWKFS